MVRNTRPNLSSGESRIVAATIWTTYHEMGSNCATGPKGGIS